MYELTADRYTIEGLRSNGGPASLTITKGNRIDAETFAAVPEADQDLFKKVRKRRAKAAPSPDTDTDS